MNTTKAIYTVTAASGTGKSTMIDAVCSQTPDLAQQAKSVTTRELRNPSDNRIFVSVGEFLALQKRGYFIESIEFGGNNAYYGIPCCSVESILAMEGRTSPLLDCNLSGVTQVRTYGKRTGTKVVSIFVVCSANDVYSRLVKRGTSPHDLKRRLQHSMTEVEGLLSGCFDNVIQNDDFDEAVAKLLYVLEGGAVNDVPSPVAFVTTFKKDMSLILSSLE